MKALLQPHADFNQQEALAKMRSHKRMYSHGIQAISDSLDPRSSYRQHEDEVANPEEYYDAPVKPPPAEAETKPSSLPQLPERVIGDRYRRREVQQTEITSTRNAQHSDSRSGSLRAIRYHQMPSSYDNPLMNHRIGKLEIRIYHVMDIQV